MYHSRETWKVGNLYMEFRQIPLCGIPRNCTEFNANSDGSTKFPAEFRTDGIPWTLLF
jgi:hypothetical protein